MFAKRMIHHGLGGSSGGGYVPPAPTASVTPGSVTFDFATNPTYVGSSSSVTITLKNTANNGSTLTLNSAPSISGDSAFSLSGGTCDLSSSLGYNGTCTTTVTFTPTSKNQVSATITFDTNAGIKTVTVVGTGLQMSATITAVTSTDFGSVLINTPSTRTFSFNNTGNVAITGAYPTVSDPSLVIVNNNIGTSGSPGTVSAGSSLTYGVRWTPTTEGALSASTSVISAAGTNSIVLSGTASNPNWILSFNEGNGSTTFTDSGNQGGSWSSYNSAATSTANSYAGGSSLLLNGTNQAVVGPAINLTGAFAIDFWFYPTSNGGGSVVPLIAQWSQASSTLGGWSITLRNGANLQMGFSFGAVSTSAPIITTNNNFYALNQWNHVRVTRSGSSVTFTCNSNTATATASGGRTLSVQTTIGNFYNASNVLGATGAAWYKGYIDEISISAAQ